MMKSMPRPMKRRHYLKFAGSFCSPLHGRQTQCLIRSLKSHGNYFPRVFVVVNPFRFRRIKPFDFEFSGLVHFLHKQDLLRDGSGTLTQGSKTDEFSEKSRGAFSIQKNYVVDSGNTWLFEHEIDTNVPKIHPSLKNPRGQQKVTPQVFSCPGRMIANSIPARLVATHMRVALPCARACHCHVHAH